LFLFRRADKKAVVAATGVTTQTRNALFQSTRWTLVLKAGDSGADAQLSDSALAELCRAYWQPIYLFLRRHGYKPPDAQDLTQGFFLHLIENRAYRRADPGKGKFRSFLLGALKYFLANERTRAEAQKRGGHAALLEFDENALREADNDAEAILRGQRSAEHVYDREWAATLLRHAFERLARECEIAGKVALFEALKTHLTEVDGSPLPYAEIAARLRRPVATLWSDVARLRARHRDILREEVRTTVAEPADVDEELRYLCEVLADA
jgi:RNA polymerase sigma-70 factor (ECF subfamily)